MTEAALLTAISVSIDRREMGQNGTVVKDVRQFAYGRRITAEGAA
jgi:hypothetical protein